MAQPTQPEILPAESAQQYFPTYRIPAQDQEVALREYEVSAQALTADQRSISVATGLVVLGIGFFGTVLGSDNGLGSLKGVLETLNVYQEVALFAVILGMAFVVMRYFADLQRSATHASRKIVVLRRLMGIDYGNVERVFPINRIEGANEPFAIPMFPGWLSIGTLASGVVAAFAGVLTSLLIISLKRVPDTLSNWLTIQVGSLPYFVPMTAALTASGLLAIYRLSLLEAWESKRFLLGKLLAFELSIPLKPRMGHVLYRAELSVYEALRVGIAFDVFKPILFFVEDKRFVRHKGNDVRAFVRAIWQRVANDFTSGGSTIDQQLFRSICLARLDRSLRRKPIEWMMAPWLRARFGTDQIWKMYLCSVRFDRGVIGLPAAATHFFDIKLDSKSSWAPSPAQVFFLIERLSNVSRTIPTRRIRARLAKLTQTPLFAESDISELKAIYLNQIGKGLINGSLADLEFQPILTAQERQSWWRRIWGRLCDFAKRSIALVKSKK
jgi:penicillin-binding protein 1A